MLLDDIDNLKKPSDAWIFSVSEVSTMMKKMVEDIFADIKIRGEISGYKKAASGHVYFSLKDAKSLINVVCWNGTINALNISLEDGLEVVCGGYISIYPGRSNYQLVAQQIQISGQGSLLALLEKRKEMLQSEGLFAAEYKKKIPYLPRSVGIITSMQGAVIKDILHRIEERFPLKVLIWNVPVQGKEAPEKIIEAIKGFDGLASNNKPDVLIIARGGGSVEDLWCFNDEVVVRSIFQCNIPIISAIGHETDFTLTDLVADLRAPTPTAAAEFAVPVKKDLFYALENSRARINHAIQRSFKEKELKLSNIHSRLKYFHTKLDKLGDGLNNLQYALDHGIEKVLKNKAHQLALVQSRILGPSALHLLDMQHERLHSVRNRLDMAINNIFNAKNMQLEIAAHSLQMSDKHRTLRKGFAIIRDEAGMIMSSAAHLSAGQKVKIEIRDGQCAAVITNVSHDL